MIHEIQVEGTFPRWNEAGDHSQSHQVKGAVVIPGEYILKEGPVEANSGKETVGLVVRNAGDRPVQVGSHFHFFEANRALLFEREKAFGMRLNIPSGTAVRFEPGQDKEIVLVSLGGERVVHGLNGLTEGALDDPSTGKSAIERAKDRGFRGA